jgi:hypothetical protein
VKPNDRGKKTPIGFDGIAFTDPVKFDDWSPKQGPGLYCICVRDPTWQPAPFRPLYFGRALNLAEQSLLHLHPAVNDWAEHADGADKLLVADAYLPQFSSDFLVFFEQRLIMRYQPRCNKIETLPSMRLPRAKPNPENAKSALYALANATEADREDS